jgi:signal transduction histidine kinase
VAAALLGQRTVGDEKRLLESLRKGGTRLSSIVSDLSDTSLLESGTFALHMAPTDVSRLVAASVERIAPRAIVSVDGDIPLVDVDPLRVEQVLTNLLVNAQKYGRRESVPTIALGRRADTIVIAVTNEGCAVPEDERTKIFEPYYRGRDRKPDARSLGLGLYICRRLVEEHGGRIWTDGDSSYARFSFSLPVPEPAPRVSETRLTVSKRPLARARAVAPCRSAEGEHGERRQAPHRHR